MTKNELIEMVGDEEQAEYTIEIVLSQLKKEFVKNAIKAKLKETESRMKELETEGIIYMANGTYNVDWYHNQCSNKPYEANSLIYTRNRLMSMIASRS